MFAQAFTARPSPHPALGVTPGATVTVLQTFPGIIFQCDETEVAIEPDVARVIVVEIIERS